MTLEAIYYITQIVAVLAIIGSLLFVGIQIRDNSRAITDQNRWSRLSEINATGRMLIENPDAMDANLKASGQAWQGLMQDLSQTWGLSVEEGNVIGWTQGTYIWTHWAQWRSMKTKTDEAELKNVLLTWYTVEPMKSVFAHPVSRALYDPEFIAWVDDILKSAPQADEPLEESGE